MMTSLLWTKTYNLLYGHQPQIFSMFML